MGAPTLAGCLSFVNMGRRRILRTPSEEREHQLRRKEMRRARIRAQTDEQRAIARAKHAELQRRRRREDPEVRQLEAAKHRARREIEAVRQREAEVRRLHRQNAAVVQHDVEAQRAKWREAQARRRRRQDPEARQLEAAKRRLRRQDAAVRQREAEARRRHRERAALRQRAALERVDFVCDVCSRPAELSPIRTSHVPMLTAQRPSKDVPSFMLCPSCQSDLRMGAIPPLTRSSAYPANPAGLCEYHSLCSSDYEDPQCLQRPARRLNSERNAQESKVDCCLQTDGTGKVDCFAQTEDAAKMSLKVPSKKCLKVAEVQTEDSSTWLQRT